MGDTGRPITDACRPIETISPRSDGPGPIERALRGSGAKSEAGDLLAEAVWQEAWVRRWPFGRRRRLAKAVADYEAAKDREDGR